jgi:hypothetical protein
MSRAVDAITPISMAAVLCLGFLLLMLPRRYAFLPMLIGGCYLTLGQAAVIAGLHFYLIRILILFGLARIVIRRELFRITPNPIDKVFILWVLVTSFLYVIVDGTHVAVTERLGYLYNAVGIYVLVRAVVTSLDDAIVAIKMCALIIMPLAVLFAMEYATGRNQFAALGGVPLYSEIRDGRFRSQGPFRHPILAGTFAATAIPLFVGLWGYRSRLLAAGAIAAGATIVFTSSSSGPLMALVLGSIGLICWSFRLQMRAVRWGIVAFLVLLDLYMKAPLWFLIDRMSEIVGGEGWYRSALIDVAIRNIHEWWLIGTGYTAHWMPTGIAASAVSADIVNEFVAQGVQGGLLALSLFIWLIVKCFSAVGTAVCDDTEILSTRPFVMWSMGCALLAHVASFFSVSYFDQITIFWYLVIGMVATLVDPMAVRSPVRATRVAPHSGTATARPRFAAQPQQPRWRRNIEPVPLSHRGSMTAAQQR